MIDAILGVLITWLRKWLSGRQAVRAQAKVAANVQTAETDGTKADQKGEQAVEAARNTDEQALVTARADAGKPDGLQSVNEDVDAAIARASSKDSL